MTTTTVTLDPADLEAMIRRVVREELERMQIQAAIHPIEDWTHEGPEDEAADQRLLVAALEEWEQYGQRRESWRSLAEVAAELGTADDE